MRTASDTPAAPTAGLITAPHFFEPGRRDRHAFTPGDDFYEALIDSHRTLDDAQSALLNARLLLLLANHIGDLAVLREALRAARLPEATPSTAIPTGDPA
ncbi:MAG: hypothetical protein RLY78_526 [Pseudomonadota bacterium]|jgi:hypothetical protein|uniref:DUF2783 domain-containing protein n=1 Tax=Pseudaquabacterium rugosum TaxID=2984194 RepID=A0ABU9BCE3_9BURK